MNAHMCIVCHYTYDPDAGDPGKGIAPGTCFEDLPADWGCPDCGAGVSEFIPVLNEEGCGV